MDIIKDCIANDYDLLGVKFYNALAHDYAYYIMNSVKDDAKILYSDEVFSYISNTSSNFRVINYNNAPMEIQQKIKKVFKESFDKEKESLDESLELIYEHL